MLRLYGSRWGRSMPRAGCAKPSSHGRSAWPMRQSGEGREVWTRSAVREAFSTRPPARASCGGARTERSSSRGSAVAGHTCTRCRGRAATATLLTPGEFEVDHVAFSPDRKRIVYSSNQYGSDPLDQDRKHLWSVTTVDGGTPQALTHGDGIETEPAIASDGEVALVRMDARMPARCGGAGGKWAARPGAADDSRGFSGGEAGDAAAGDLQRGGRHADSWAAFSAATAMERRSIRRWCSSTADRGGRCCWAGITWTTTRMHTR